MAAIDRINRIGRSRLLRPAGAVLHWGMTRLPFAAMIRSAGRRMASASAGPAALLLTQAGLHDALHDPSQIYQAVRFTIEEMGLDTSFLFTDLGVEAEACGCRLQYSERDLPMVVTHPLQLSDDPGSLRVPDPHRDGRMPVFLEAMRRIRRNYAMFTSAGVTGPFTLAAHLRGADIYLDTAINPEAAGRILAYCTEVITAYARALIEAGADMILLAEPAGSQLSPAGYDRFSQAYTRKIIGALARPCTLHVCGRTGHVVDKMCASGAAAISVDDVDLPSLLGRAPRQVVIIGNISPLVLLNCSPDEIRAQTAALLERAGGRKEFIAAPGCDLAPETPLENIQAFVRTVKTYRCWAAE